MRSFGVIFFLSSLPLAVFAADPTPNAVRDVFRFMTYNIHHGQGIDKQVDLKRIADLIRAEKADLVVLQEVDRGAKRTQGLDMPAILATATGLTCIFSNNFAIEGGEYGNALLSRFPIRSWTNTHLTKLGEVEQRGLLEAVVDIHGQSVRIACTHLDAGRENPERLHQVEQIRKLLATEQPLILGGDFNETPQSAIHRQLQEHWIDLWPLVGEGDGFTIPAPQGTRRIDYVWIQPNSILRPKRAWIPTSEASDHLPLVVEFKLIRN